MSEKAFWLIPKKLMTMPELTKSSILVLAEIAGIIFSTKICYYSNAYIADQLNMHEKYVSKIIKDLDASKFIDVYYKGNKRHIGLTEKTYKIFKASKSLENKQPKRQRLENPLDAIIETA